LQKEVRTLWEATDTYIRMSPFMIANKIKKPILLMHGEEDSKVTTAMQVATVASGVLWVLNVFVCPTVVVTTI
jgi:dipeptidyl aminopeptidase/acylaminoacyl peptidase